MTDVDILIKFPSRSRPEKMLEHLYNIKATVGIERYLVYLIVDEDDPTMTDKVRKSISDYERFMNLVVSWGKSKSKIDAINRAVVTSADYKYTVVTSDDMKYTRYDWGGIVLSAFKYTGKDCLHFPDGHNSSLITLPVLRKRFIDRFGYVYHPDYFSVYADDEMTAVAKITKEYYYVPVDIVEHRHYRWGYGQADQQNLDQDGSVAYGRDMIVFNNHKANNFGL